MFFDIQKLYNSGIEYLEMGGEIVDENFFCEKDVLEEDYSEPTLSGRYEVASAELIKGTRILNVEFEEGGGLLLTRKEYEAGLCN